MADRDGVRTMSIANEEKFLAAAIAEGGMPISAGAGAILKSMRRDGDHMEAARRQSDETKERVQLLDELLSRAKNLNDQLGVINAELDDVLRKASQIRSEIAA